MSLQNIGMIGLAVMGENLVLNMESKGFSVAGFDIDKKRVEIFKQGRAKNKNIKLASSLEELVSLLEVPRKIMIMIRAGKPVDMVIESLLPLLDKGDIIIDGGNSHYPDTIRRHKLVEDNGFLYIGSGVSGGEEGALKGPSIMPGGSFDAWKHVGPIFKGIAAKTENGDVCAEWIGSDGAGHYVKMVHNGIEYAEMQLLAEIVVILKELGNNPDVIAAILETWKSSASSYLLEITIDILRKKEGNAWLVDKIMDKAGNKGTGNWTTIATAELGVPSSLIATALFARYTSFYKDERVQLNKLYDKKTAKPSLTVEEVFEAYQFSRIINHYQGIKLISEASKSFKWNINLSEMARIWTNGCIIRSTFMEELVEVLKETDNILINTAIIEQVKSLKAGANKVIAQCILAEIAISCISESINFFNGLTTANSSANIIQAQRDYFGAHTYQRIDDETAAYHHTQWNN